MDGSINQSIQTTMTYIAVEVGHRVALAPGGVVVALVHHVLFSFVRVVCHSSICIIDRSVRLSSKRATHTHVDTQPADGTHQAEEVPVVVIAQHDALPAPELCVALVGR